MTTRAVHGLRRHRRADPVAVPDLRHRGTRARPAHHHRRRAGRHRGRHAHPAVRPGRGRPRWRPGRRPLRRDLRAAARHVHPRRRRPALHHRGADDRGRAGHRPRADHARRRGEARHPRRHPERAPCSRCAARACRGCAARRAATCTCTSTCARRPGWTRSRSGCCASSPRCATRTSPSVTKGGGLFGKVRDAFGGTLTGGDDAAAVPARPRCRRGDDVAARPATRAGTPPGCAGCAVGETVLVGDGRGARARLRRSPACAATALRLERAVDARAVPAADPAARRRAGAAEGRAGRARRRDC